MGKYQLQLRFIIWLFLFTSSTLLFAQDGKLEEIRKETNKTSKRDNTEEKRSHHHAKDADDSDSIMGEIFGPIIAYVLISPYYMPYSFWDDGFDTPYCFHPYPYYQSEKGYLKESDEVEWAAFDLSGEFKIYKNSVYGIGLNFKARTSFRLEVHADYNFLEEKLDNGTTDSLYLGNINVLFRFAQNEKLLMHSGFGLNILGDKDDKYGFNYNYSLEVYPFKPMYFAIGADFGQLGGSSYIRFRVSTGVIHRSYELSVGFESYNIGDATLEGIIFGLKIYF